MAIQKTHAFTRKILCLWVFGVLLTNNAYSQDGQSQLEKPAYAVDRANVPDAIAKVKSGEFALVHVDMIARADAVEAIPILKEQFVRVQDPLAKAKLAAALLRLGDKDDACWDFLRDPRAIPFLRRALSSPNYKVEIAAALGLAEIGDKDSIPFITEACKKAPADVASVIAESLIYFDSTEAQSAVDKFIPKHLADIYRDARAHGQKTPMSPPFRN
jgi:HEAT repeats